MSEHECRHLPEPVWNPTRCPNCGAMVRLRPFWTSDPPTVPGDYLYAYRFYTVDDWTQGRMRLSAEDVPVKPDTSDTRWFGPIPEIEPATGADE